VGVVGKRSSLVQCTITVIATSDPQPPFTDEIAGQARNDAERAADTILVFYECMSNLG